MKTILVMLLVIVGFFIVANLITYLIARHVRKSYEKATKKKQDYVDSSW